MITCAKVPTPKFCRRFASTEANAPMRPLVLPNKPANSIPHGHGKMPRNGPCFILHPSTRNGNCDKNKTCKLVKAAVRPITNTFLNLEQIIATPPHLPISSCPMSSFPTSNIISFFYPTPICYFVESPRWAYRNLFNFFFRYSYGAKDYLSLPHYKTDRKEFWMKRLALPIAEQLSKNHTRNLTAEIREAAATFKKH
jgi:hypothetical protein